MYTNICTCISTCICTNIYNILYTSLYQVHISVAVENIKSEVEEVRKVKERKAWPLPLVRTGTGALILGYVPFCSNFQLRNSVVGCRERKGEDANCEGR